VGRPRLQYLKKVARNTGADSYGVMKRRACNNSRWKAANQWDDWRIRRRRQCITIFTRVWHTSASRSRQIRSILFTVKARAKGKFPSYWGVQRETTQTI